MQGGHLLDAISVSLQGARYSAGQAAQQDHVLLVLRVEKLLVLFRLLEVPPVAGPNHGLFHRKGAGPADGYIDGRRPQTSTSRWGPARQAGTVKPRTTSGWGGPYGDGVRIASQGFDTAPRLGRTSPFRGVLGWIAFDVPESRPPHPHGVEGDVLGPGRFVQHLVSFLGLPLLVIPFFPEIGGPEPGVAQ